MQTVNMRLSQDAPAEQILFVPPTEFSIILINNLNFLRFY